MKKVLILSGAGISAESGISTFRDSDGLWEEYDVKVICNYDSMFVNPELTIEFYDKRREELDSKEPNHAHKVIASLKEKYKENLIVMTQNVDDLFEKAGIAHEDVIHLHGFLPELRCQNCDTIFNVGYSKQKSFHNGICPECDGALRPNIIFFGEPAPKYELLNYHVENSEVIIIIGTSGNVIEVNHMARTTQLSILNNLEPSEAIDDTNFTKTLYKPATEAIDEIREEIEFYFQQYDY